MIPAHVTGPDAEGQWTVWDRRPGERIVIQTADARQAGRAMRQVLASDLCGRGGVEPGGIAALNGAGRAPAAVAAETERSES